MFPAPTDLTLLLARYGLRTSLFWSGGTREQGNCQSFAGATRDRPAWTEQHHLALPSHFQAASALAISAIRRRAMLRRRLVKTTERRRRYGHVAISITSRGLKCALPAGLRATP
jgi:hypothetical protein